MGFVGVVKFEVLSIILIWTCSIGRFQALGSPPRIIRNLEEIVVQSHDTISLRCEGKKRILWNHTLPEDLTEYSRFHDRWKVIDTISDENSGYRFIAQLEVTEASHADTGYFYCLHEGTANYNDIENVAKVFVYVNYYKVPIKYDFEASNNLMTYEHNAWIGLSGYQTLQLILPCVPTSPDVSIMLFQENTQMYPPPTVQNPKEETWKYDAHIGFYVDSATVSSHSHRFECKATAPYARDVHLVSLEVHIQPKPEGGVPQPIIKDENNGYTMINGSIMLKCSVTVDVGARFSMNWTLPSEVARNEVRLKINASRIDIQNSSQFKNSVSHLTIERAKKEDGGEYICSVTDRSTNMSTSTLVNIFDPTMSHIKLEGIPHITANASLNIQWVVDIDANPDPERIWRKPDGEVIKPGIFPRFEIKQERKSSMLFISHLSLDDAGVYTFTARAGDKTETRNLTLNVRDRPKVTLTNEHSDMIQEGKRFTLTCTVKAYPKPNVTFYFRSCAPPWNCSRDFVPLNTANQESLKNEKIIDDLTVQRKMTDIAKKSGQYLCEACNPGCHNGTVDVTVTDVLNGFTLSGMVENPVEADNTSLVCSVSLFKFQKVVSWFYTNDEGKEIKLTEGSTSSEIVFSRKFTNQATFQETLNFPNISIADTGVYKCQAVDLKNVEYNSTNVPLKVLALQELVIVNTSHPDTIIAYPGDSVHIFCQATGVPVPTVEWSKDGEEYEHYETEDTYSSVMFPYIKLENSGTYTCKYSIKAVIREKTFVLRVNERRPVNTGIIIGVVFSAIIFIAVLALLLYKIMQEKKRAVVWNVKHLNEFLSGNLTSINPELGIDEQAELLPYDKQWEFPRERLHLGKQLGSGAFGRVLKGEATGITPNEAISVVAVKMVKSQANYSAFKALLSEIKVMIHLGSHLNVVNLLGACTQNIAKGELLVIVEYCKFGNLQHYLIRNRENFVNQIDPIKGTLDPNIGAQRFDKEVEDQRVVHFANDSYDVPQTPEVSSPRARFAIDTSFRRESANTETDCIITDSNGQSMGINSSGSQIQAPWRSNFKGDYRGTAGPLRTQDLLCWSFQIARGMEYLGSRKVLHGDLAARNILLAENNVVKICDFGLAREVYKNGGNYKKKGDGPLPVKWMAAESISDLIFSTQSDVWSFGIVLWEIFSLGKTPYPDLQADDVFFKKIQAGYHMECPKYATKQIYEVMVDCWNMNPISRPSFTDLQESLGDLLEDSVRRHYTDLNNPYNLLNSERKKDDYVDMVGRPDYANLVGGARPLTTLQDYVNAAPTVEGQITSDYLAMSPSVTHPSIDQQNQFTLNNSSYLFMATPSRTQTPDLFSPKGQSPKFSFDFNSKLRRVDEEPHDLIEMQTMQKSGTNHLQANHAFIDKITLYNDNKKLHDDDDAHHDATRQDSDYSDCPSRSFSNPSYA